MKFLRFFLLCILLTFIYAAAGRAETTIKAEVDKTGITTDELLTYKLSIASTEKNLPRPKLPSFDGFVIVSQAQSNTVSYRKGGMQTILVFAFILMPKQAAAVTIGPARITVQGTDYTSESLQIDIKQGTSRPPRNSRGPVPGRQKPLPEEEPFPEELNSSQPRYEL